MTALFRGKYPRAFLHIDGDAFFASCEQARDPALRGKPVVTGLERGIAASMSYEAKARGVTRAMRLSDIRRLCPDAVILPSDYETYSLLSQRFYNIVRRYTADVEEYGIDECFAELSGWQRPLGMNYQEIARHIQEDLLQSLGFTFSIGLAPTKVLAKIGSKWRKPHGLVSIPSREIPLYLKKIGISRVWGIGRQTSARMYEFGIFTAFDFIQKSEGWVREHFALPHQEIWQELRGKSVLPILTEGRAKHYSVQKMKTFTPPSADKDFVFSQLCRNIEAACMKARLYHRETSHASILLRTQEFRHASRDVALPHATSFPHHIIQAVRPAFEEIFQPGTLYRATMASLTDLRTPSGQIDFLEDSAEAAGYRRLYESVDQIRKKYGKYTVHLGASHLAQKFVQHQGERGEKAARTTRLFRGESARKRLNIPVFRVPL